MMNETKYLYKSFCPYRVCPLGAHSDHQYGKVTGIAVDKGITVFYSPTENGDVTVSSAQFSPEKNWNVNSFPEVKVGDWADYLRGATSSLKKRHRLERGINGRIEGSLPVGGLSSSAAVIIAFLKALCHVNDITLTPAEMIVTALEAENEYVGVSCGKLDQSCEVYCRKDHLLYLDTRDDSYELIPTPANMRQYSIMILFSGVERTLAGSKFNMRVDECRSAAYALKAYAGMEYGKFADTHMREVPREVFDEYGKYLPENWRRRAEHWYTEYARVEAGAEAWRRGDIEEFGRLSFESGRSSIENWETGSPELKRIYELMKETQGVFGGRFSGAGFKGCCMALVDPAYEEQIGRYITKEYLGTFPDYDGKFSVHMCSSADGVSF